MTTVRFKQSGLAEVAARTLSDLYPDHLYTFTGRTLRTDMNHGATLRALFRHKVTP